MIVSLHSALLQVFERPVPVVPIDSVGKLLTIPCGTIQIDHHYGESGHEIVAARGNRWTGRFFQIDNISRGQSARVRQIRAGGREQRQHDDNVEFHSDGCRMRDDLQFVVNSQANRSRAHNILLQWERRERVGSRYSSGVSNVLNECSNVNIVKVNAGPRDRNRV